MVKFSKQFEGQLVPEWKYAFVDYSQLKKDLKRMKHSLLVGHHDHCKAGLTTNTQQTTDHQQAQRSSLSRWLFHKLPTFFGVNAPTDHGVIQVHRKLTGSASRGGDVYETEVLEQLFIDTDAAREFFARLDRQLNKVNQFYKGKEEEFLERGQSLRKQMDILADLKAAREDPSVSCSLTSSSSGEFLRKLRPTDDHGVRRCSASLLY